MFWPHLSNQQRQDDAANQAGMPQGFYQGTAGPAAQGRAAEPALKIQRCNRQEGTYCRTALRNTLEVNRSAHW